MSERNPDVPLIYRQVFDVVEGPLLTSFKGELGTPVLCCIKGDSRCKNFAVHDYHYFYCAGQLSKNNNESSRHPYPWRGAGKQIRDPEPDEGCPYIRQEES